MNKNNYWQAVLGAIPVGVIVVDETLAIQAFNPAAETITDIEAEHAIGKPYAEVMRTHSRSIVDPLEEALATGETFVNQRFYLRDNNDGSVPIRHSASVLIGADGEVIGGVTIFADISKQVALERRLEGHRRYLRDVLRSMPDGVMTTDPGLCIKSWNKAAAKITGRPASEAIGRPCIEILGSGIASVLESLFNGGENVVDHETEIVQADGETCSISFSASEIMAPEDDVRGGIVIFRDIRERLERQRTLDLQKRYLSQILDLAPDAIFTVDENLVIQTFNQAAEELTGYAASFAVGKPYSEIIKIDPDSGTDPLPLLVTMGGADIRLRLKLADAGGKRIPIRYGAAALVDTQEQRMGGVVIFQDISDLVAAERTKNEFVSMVSHELRTPLTSIKGFVTAILQGRAGEINDRQKRFLSICREQSNLLLSLINDLLDLSRLESGKMEPDLTRVDVADLVKRAATAIIPLAGRKEIAVEYEIEPDLPSLWADEDKMFQVLQNLLSNAVKFTPNGGNIQLGAHLVETKTILFEVSDDGIGMAPEEREYIFEPFYQVENIQTRQVGGTGLGLPIVKRIVLLHGGRIEVESQPGAGSTFRIYLPVAKTRDTVIYTPSEEEERTPSAPMVAPPKPARLNPLIMVVDDDPAVTALLQFTLEEEGYDVITAPHGNEALRMAEIEQPDLITLDVLMPEIDGFRVLDMLKQKPETVDIPVCIVSIVEDKVKGYTLGAIDYITKPFESEQLIGAIDAVLNPSLDGDEIRVLVVDDDPTVVELVELILADEQHQVLTAYDGVTALEKIRHHLPHLVLLDIMIPKIDGYEVIRQTKRDPRTAEIPIIVLSVRSLEEDISRALRLGAERYLTKSPGPSEDLTQAIKDVVKETLDDGA